MYSLSHNMANDKLRVTGDRKLDFNEYIFSPSTADIPSSTGDLNNRSLESRDKRILDNLTAKKVIVENKSSLLPVYPVNSISRNKVQIQKPVAVGWSTSQVAKVRDTKTLTHNVVKTDNKLINVFDP